MNYLDIAEARALPGLRLVLSMGVPGPWGEAAKAVLQARRVPYRAVGQTPMAPNDELRGWTGVRNAPVAVLDEEPPLTGWLDILMLAERLGSGPSLLPEGLADQATCLGLSALICGPDGYGWSRRLSIMAQAFGLPQAENLDRDTRAMRGGYGLTGEAIARAPRRAADILRLLARRLHEQAALGSAYLVGARLSAADLYWACFSQMGAPLPREVNPMPDYLWPLYTAREPEVADAFDPILIEHRDRVYRDHIGLPLDY